MVRGREPDEEEEERRYKTEMSRKGNEGGCGESRRTLAGVELARKSQARPSQLRRLGRKR